jgi:hypothetical protein
LPEPYAGLPGAAGVDRAELVGDQWSHQLEVLAEVRQALESGSLDEAQKQRVEELIGRLDALLEGLAEQFEVIAQNLRALSRGSTDRTAELLHEQETVAWSQAVGLGYAAELCRLRDSWQRNGQR